MDWTQLVEVVRAAEGHSLADLIKAIVKNHGHPLPNGRWTVQTDDKKWGHAVVGHNFGLNAQEGVWARWKWVENGEERSLEATEVERLTLVLDGEDVDSPAVRITTGTEHNFPHVYLVVHFLFDEGGKRHDYRFAGRMS